MICRLFPSYKRVPADNTESTITIQARQYTPSICVFDFLSFVL